MKRNPILRTDEAGATQMVEVGDRVLLTTGATARVRGFRTILPRFAEFHGGEPYFVELGQLRGPHPDPRMGAMNTYPSQIVRVLKKGERAPRPPGVAPRPRRPQVETLTGARVYFIAARKRSVRDALLAGDLSPLHDPRGDGATSSRNKDYYQFWKSVEIAPLAQVLAVEVDPTVRFLLNRNHLWDVARWQWEPWEEDMIADVPYILDYWHERIVARGDWPDHKPPTANDVAYYQNEIRDLKWGVEGYPMFARAYAERGGYAGISWPDRVWIFPHAREAIMRIRPRVRGEGQ